MAILMGIMIVAIIATLIKVINIYNEMPKEQKHRSQVKIRDFYRELSDYAGGYLMRLDHQETMGKIKNILIEKRTSSDTLVFVCEWTVGRKFNLNSSWEKYTVGEENSSKRKYFNLFYSEDIWNIEKAQIFTIGEGTTSFTLIVDKNGRAYMLFKPDHSLKENDWESIIPKVEK